MWQSNTNNAVCCFDSSILHCHPLVDASMGSTNSTTLNTIMRHLQCTVLKPKSTYCDYYGSMLFEIRNIILAYLDVAAITHLSCNLGSVRFLITLFNSHIQLLWLLFFFLYLKREKLLLFSFVCWLHCQDPQIKILCLWDHIVYNPY